MTGNGCDKRHLLLVKRHKDREIGTRAGVEGELHLEVDWERGDDCT